MEKILSSISIKDKIRACIASYQTITVHKSNYSSILSKLHTWTLEDSSLCSNSSTVSFLNENSSQSSTQSSLQNSSQSSPQNSLQSSPQRSPQRSIHNSPRSMRIIKPCEERPHVTPNEWKSMIEMNDIIQLPLSGIQRLYEVFCFHHTDGYLTLFSFYNILSLSNPAFGHSKKSIFFTRLFFLFCDGEKGLTCVEWILAVSILCNKSSLMTLLDVMFYILGNDELDVITLENIEYILSDFDEIPDDKNCVIYKTFPTKGKVQEYTSEIWQLAWKNITRLELSYEDFLNYIKSYPFLLIPITLDWHVVDLCLPIESP